MTQGRPSDARHTILQRFVFWFSVVLAASALHRLGAIRVDAYATIWDLFQPGSERALLSIWASQFGDAALRGFAQDILFTVLAAVLFCLLTPVLSWLSFGLLAAFYASNIEHVKFNLAHIDLATLGNAVDPTFVGGMMNTGLIAYAAVFLVIPVVAFILFKARVIRAIAYVITAVIAPLGAYSFAAQDFVKPDWVQTHPLLPNSLLERTKVNERAFEDTLFAYRPPQEITPDLNVLVVYIEGLSGHSLDAMPTLSQLAAENVTFDRYFGTQLLTANGLYASLTGDLPFLTSGHLKWDGLTPTSEVAVNALPMRFREAGYHTAFLQSARLSYMSKLTVLPMLGFDVMRGDLDWRTHNARNSWGIDDLALYGHVADYISERDKATPWFISVLTTGTHAPYNIPPDEMTEATVSRRDAVASADRAVNALLARLANIGVLDDTVVILTSDEAREPIPGGDLRSEVALNWLPLIILHPSGLNTRVPSYLTALDFPEIIATVAQRDPVPGLERLRARTDSILFANTFSKRVFVYDPADQSLLVCTTKGFACATFPDVEDIVTFPGRQDPEIAQYPALEDSVRATDTRPLE